MKDELGAGLNMLNTTNLDYFGAHHQAEIFRLKGVFLQVRSGFLGGWPGRLSVGLVLFAATFVVWPHVLECRF
jgi:hypothetical protein